MLAVFSVHTSALNLTDGHTGLYALRSAYTLEQGNYSYGVWLSSEQYVVPGSSTQLQLNDLTMSFHQGVTDRLEVGMYFPARMGVASGTFDFQHFGFSLKYKTDETPATKDAVSFTVYGGILAADPASGLGSGESNYGISFDYSNKIGRSVIHSNIGIENSDAISITAPATATFSPSSKIFWRLGSEMRYSDTSSFNLGIELGTDLENVGTTTSILLPSYTYNSTDKHLRYTLGLGYNLQAMDNLPASSVYIGMNYNLESPNKKMSRLERRLAQLEGMLNNFTTSQSSQDNSLALMDERLNYLYNTDIPTYNGRIDSVEKRLAGLKQPSLVHAPVVKKPKMAAMGGLKKSPGKSMKVEIINRTGSKKLAQRISNRLKKKGYIVVRIIDDKKKRLNRSYVYYQKGYDKQAVNLGHSLPKNQIIGRSGSLGKDVNLRLVIGNDLK